MGRTTHAEPGGVLTLREVAAMFQVDAKTVARWARSGRLTSVRTLGGQRRFPAAEVLTVLHGIPAQRQP